MGCAHTRSKIDEDIIEDYEQRLQFTRFTIGEIKQGFSHISGASSVSLAQIEKLLKNLNIKYSWEDKREAFDIFIAHFEIGDDTYDLIDLLAALFLLSKNSIEEKALALFDLFDKRCSGSLYKEDAEFAFDCICKVVCNYSEGFLKEEQESKEMHIDIWTREKDAKVPKLVDFFFEGRAFINYETFKASLVKASRDTELLDITSPRRAGLMEYLFSAHKSKEGGDGSTPSSKVSISRRNSIDSDMSGKEKRQ